MLLGCQKMCAKVFLECMKVVENAHLRTLKIRTIGKVGYVLTTTVAFDCLEDILQSSLELIPSNLVNFTQQSGKI